MKRPLILVLGIVLAWACTGQTPGEASQARRVMPPPSLDCDRNQLTSYTGVVRVYERGERQILIVIDTDAETVERVLVELLVQESWRDRLLVNGTAFEDFASLEDGNGNLLPGMRAIAWVCEDGKTGPVIDWRPASL